MTSIENVSTYIPNQRIAVSKLASSIRLPEQTVKLMREYGIEKVAVETEKKIHEMMIEAAKKIIEKKPLLREEVGIILVTNTFSPIYPYLFEPFIQFQKEYGLEKSQWLSVSQMNCASLNLAIQLGVRSVRMDNLRRGALLLVGDKIIVPEMRYLNGSTFSGDAAAAVYISPEVKRNRIVCSALSSEAKIFNSIESPESKYKWFLQSSPFGLVKVIRQALKESELSVENIDLFFPSNVNKVLWERVATILNLPLKKFYFPSLADVGHAHNADPVINFDRAERKGIMKSGHYYALISIGIGGTFGCTIIQH
jgi:3-oxoacyl-[acyl-carrier-protein] synthase III